MAAAATGHTHSASAPRTASPSSRAVRCRTERGASPTARPLPRSNGSGGNVFSISSGSLPAGLSLNSSTGASPARRPDGGHVQLHGVSARRRRQHRHARYSVNIIVPIIVNPASLPNGTTGTPYNQTVNASNGTGPYTFAVIAGALPTGLSLNTATGAITGTPSAAGSFGFTIEATDSNGNKGNRPYNVTISTAPLTINPASLPAGQVGTPYSQTVTASGGNGNYSYAVVVGFAADRPVAQSGDRRHHRQSLGRRHIQLHRPGDRHLANTGTGPTASPSGPTR